MIFVAKNVPFKYRVWQSSADAAGIAERGLRFIHQPSDYFYLVRRNAVCACIIRLTLPRIVVRVIGWATMFSGRYPYP